MFNLLRKFLRPTLREQLEAGVREALRRYAERHTSPNLRVYVSTDLIREGIEPAPWARDEAEHLRRFALQWAEDNQVPRTGLRVEVVLLDTKREFAFVKPLAVDPPDGDGSRGTPPGSAQPRVTRGGRLFGGTPDNPGTAILEVVSSPSVTEPITVTGEVVLGRRADDAGVIGLGDRYLSSRHARFHIAGGRLYITDLDSRNRTYLNDHPLPPHEPVPASTGDEVRLGSTTLRVARVAD